MGDRPHCEKPAACDAITPGKHCRRCCNRALHRDPEIQARRIAASRAASQAPEQRALRSEMARQRYSDPAQRARTGSAVRAALRADPEKRARHRAAAVRNGGMAAGADVMHDARRAWIANMTPEQRRRHFGRRGYKAGLHGDDLKLYEKLNKSGVPCAEARAIVDEDARGRPARILAEMEAKAAREKAQAY